MNAPLRSSTDVRSRRALVNLLKQDGPQDAASMAERLGVTAMAVRQHLYTLQEEGLVGHQTQARPVGRPAKLWHLTEAADALFPDAHAELAVSLLSTLREAVGETGLEKILSARARVMIASYGHKLFRRRGLKGRIEGLAAIRSEEGYMASAERDANGIWWLMENHCPICSAARECQGLCAIEQQVFQAVLGDSVTVERTEHILKGARRCAYRIAAAE